MSAPTVSAMATAASLPEGTSSALKASSRVSTSPSCRSAEDSPTEAALPLTTTCVSSGAFSKATMAVMIFVMEAIWVGACALRSK